MRKLSISSSQVVGQGLQKLWVKGRTLPQVVFATDALGITYSFVRSLFELTTQLFTLRFWTNNSYSSLLMHTVHRPYKEYYKGD